MASVFLSYAREDRSFAARIAKVVEADGHSVWWDRRLDGGEEFSSEIEAELDAADVVIVIWSTQSVKSRWVRDEASVGGDRGSLVPVSIDGTQPPMGFRQFHTIDLGGWKGARRDRRTAELLHAVHRKLKADLGPQPSSSLQEPGRSPAGARTTLGLAATVGLVIILAAIGAAFFSYRSAKVQSSKPTIALVPFTTASDDPQLREIASEARDSLAHTFSQSGVPLQLVASAPQNGRLKADYVISGDLSRTGDSVVAAVRVDDATHDATVFSHKFEASAGDVPNLAERIGAHMAGDLTWAAPLMILDPSHPLEPALAADLLAGYDFGAGDPLSAYQNAVRVAAKAPNVRIAQITAAFDTSFVLDQIPRSERPAAVTMARAAADRAMKLGADFGDTYATWCLLHSDVLLSECESHLRTGRRIDPDAPFLNTFLSQLLRGVGRYEEAADLAGLSYSHDPYVPTKIGWMLLSAEYQGDDDSARTLYQEGVLWWPEFKIPFSNDRLRGVMERGDLDAIPALEKEIGKDGWAPGYADSGILTVDWKSMPAVQRFCSQPRKMLIDVRCMLVLARFGDFNRAYAIADELYPRRLGNTAAETEKIWLDDPSGAGWTEFITSAAAAPLRRDPRYMILAQRTGLLEYWRTGTPPDFCQSRPEPICASLLKRR